MPSAANAASNARVNRESRSRSTNVSVSTRLPRSISRLRAACAVHAPVGLAVIPARCARRVPCSTTINAWIRLRNTVSTCMKSTATMPLACEVRIADILSVRDVWRSGARAAR